MNSLRLFCSFIRRRAYPNAHAQALFAFSSNLVRRAPKQQEAVVTTATAPGDVLLATHKELETRTKSGLARATARAAEAAAKAAEPLPISSTAHLHDLAQSAARIFGWNTDGPQVQLNQQFRITQEQLEQIRQLRDVSRTGAVTRKEQR